MGCLNVDDKWFDDPRRDSLIELIGQTAADGTAMKMWRLAETWYRKDSIVPREIFFTHKHAKEFLTVKLAEERPDGVYIKGSKEFFQYITDAKEGKKKAGETRAATAERDEKGRFLPQQEPSMVQQASSTASGVQPNPASSSSSFSFSLSSAVAGAGAGNDDDDDPEKISLFSDPDVREFVKSVKTRVQRLWVDTYGGKATVEAEIKKAIVQWEAGSKDNPDYRGDHAIPLYLNRWFNRPKKVAPREGPRESAKEIAKPAIPPRPCVIAGYLPDSKLPVCKTHRLGEPCTLRDNAMGKLEGIGG